LSSFRLKKSKWGLWSDCGRIPLRRWGVARLAHDHITASIASGLSRMRAARRSERVDGLTGEKENAKNFLFFASLVIEDEHAVHADGRRHLT
jgi:hypothetical protein